MSDQNQTSTPVKRTYGWKRETEPVNAKRKVFSHKFAANVTHGDVSKNFNIPCYDQGQLGACTAHAWSYAIEYDEYKQGEANASTPARLMFYYCERDIDGDISQDGGSTLSTGQKVCQTIGSCPESMYPYDVSKFTDKPPQSCYDAAAKNKGLQFQQINQTVNDIKAAIIEGYPIPFGFTVYSEFESDQVAQSGVLPDPTADDQSVGGHAVCIVGFDDTKKAVLVRNSWGTSWGTTNTAGQRGYFWMSYNYVTNPNWASDFWIVEKLSEPEPTPAPAPQPEPTPAPAPAPQPEPTPAPAPAPQPEPTPAPAPAPAPAPQPEPTPTPGPNNQDIWVVIGIPDPINGPDFYIVDVPVSALRRPARHHGVNVSHPAVQARLGYGYFH